MGSFDSLVEVKILEGRGPSDGFLHQSPSDTSTPIGKVDVKQVDEVSPEEIANIDGRIAHDFATLDGDEARSSADQLDDVFGIGAMLRVDRQDALAIIGLGPSDLSHASSIGQGALGCPLGGAFASGAA